MADGFLAIDLGTSAVKALIVDVHGRLLGSGSTEHPIAHPAPGFAEQNPDVWWTATVLAVRQALSAAGSIRIHAIGLTGQMHGTVFIGDDRPIAPAIIWADARSGDEARELTEHISQQRLIESTGSQLATGFQAATIRWVQRHQSELLSRTRQILLPKDFLRWQLTGAFATEPSDASGTLLFDVRARDWSSTILDGLQLDPSLLPPVRPSIAITGNLTEQSAAELGLQSGIPVVAGGGDAPCAALGAGIVEPGSMFLTISTGAQVFLPTSEPVIDILGRIHTFCSTLEPDPHQLRW